METKKREPEGSRELFRAGLKVKFGDQNHLAWMIGENRFRMVKCRTAGNFHRQDICSRKAQWGDVADVTGQVLGVIEEVRSLRREFH